MNTNQTSQIVKSSVRYSTNLLDAEKDYVADFKNKKLSELERLEVEKHFFKIVSQAYSDIGNYSVSKENIKLSITSLLNECLPYKHRISPTGVENAVKRGIRKEFGDYYGINAVSFNLFLKSYMESTERRNAIEKQKRYEEQLEREKENSMYIDSGQTFTIYSYEKYKESKVLYDPANVAYDWLKKKNLIPTFTKEDKEAIKMEAEQRVRTFQEYENSGVPASEYILKRLQGRGEKKKETFDEKVLALCKQLHLRKIYDQITLEQIEQANDKAEN